MLDAGRYYESQAANLGADFLSKVESAVKDIADNPDRWPVIRSHVRRRFVHRFPYAILYRATRDEIVVLAVMNLHRHPNYWINRQ